MQKFNNTANQQAAQKSLGFATAACFALSTLSSTIAVWAGAMAFLDTKFQGSSDSFFISAAVFCGVLYFCYMIDFFGISKVGKLFFTEIAAWASRSFAKYSHLRLISMGLWAAIFFAFSLISFATSFYGSDMVKAFAAPKLNVSELQKVSDKRLAAQDKINAPLAERRAAIELSRAKDLKEVGTKELRKLANSGDEFAEIKLKPDKKKVNVKYDNQLAQIDKDARAEKDALSGTQDAIDKAQLLAINNTIDTQQSQANAVGVITLAFGVFPLIIGIIMIGIMAVTEVGDKVESEKNKSASGAGFSGGSSHGNAHARSIRQGFGQGSGSNFP